MNFNLRKSTVYLALSGSRAYGTFTEKSDYDFRGVCIPPLYNYVFDKFEQTVDKPENKHLFKHYQDLNIPENSEFQIMELSKFANLGIINNPNVIEILFLNNIYLCHPVFQKLLDIRKSFLSKRCKKSFIGYALNQLHRAKKHKKYLEDPPKEPPLRKNFGLPDYTVIPKDQLGAAQSLIEKEIQNYSINQNFLPEETKVELENDFRKMMQAVWQGLHTEEYPIGYKKQYSSTEEVLYNLVVQEQQFTSNFIEILKKERAYRLAKHEYDCYLDWLRDRNSERAELEKKFGIDLKHMSHVVRLILTGKDIVITGEVIVQRPEAEMLRRIRSGEALLDGTWSYEKFVEFAEKEIEELEKLIKNSSLPDEPDENKIRKVVFDMILEFNGEKHEL